MIISKDARMKDRRFLAALLIALAVTACSKKSGDQAAATIAATGPVAAVPPPAGKAWTDMVETTPEDGVRMGNPNAPIKLVEYASFTCPHCKHFEDEAADPLQQKYIATGKVSWEYRSMVIHGPDAAITLLMNCRGAGPYFKLAQQLFATQDTWFGDATIAKLTADQQRLQSLPTTEQFKALVDTLGLYSFFAARGLPRAQADACLTDQKAIDRLTATQQRYSSVDNINSTPTMIINKVQWSPPSETQPLWAQLDAELAKLTK
jgi:protein-disulfide isomerase